MKPIFSAFLALALAASPILGAHAQVLPASTIDSIVAVVDEDVILRSELDLAVANIRKQFADGQNGQLPPPEVLEKQVLERLILMRLQINRAADSGIRISDQELQQAIGTIASQNKMSPDQLRQRVAFALSPRVAVGIGEPVEHDVGALDERASLPVDRGAPIAHARPAAPPAPGPPC